MNRLFSDPSFSFFLSKTLIIIISPMMLWGMSRQTAATQSLSVETATKTGAAAPLNHEIFLAQNPRSDSDPTDNDPPLPPRSHDHPAPSNSDLLPPK